MATSTCQASFAKRPPVRPRCLRSDARVCRNGTGGPSALSTNPDRNLTVSARRGDDCAILPACASPAIRLDRLVLPLDPPFPAAWDPVPRRSFAATVVRVETDEGVVGIGSGDTMDGFEAFEHLFIGDGSAGDRPPRARPRDDRLPRRPLLADRGRAVGHHRPGRRAAGRDALRWRDRRHPGLRLVRDAAVAGRPRRIRAAAARGGVHGAQDPDRPAAARGGPGGGRGDPRTRSAIRWRSWSTSTRAGGWPATRRPSLDPVAARAIAVRLAEYDVLWLEEPLAGTDLRGLAALRASAPGVRIAGGEMTRTFSELLAAVEADAFDVHQPDVVLAAGMLRGADGRASSPWRATAGSRRTPGRTGSGCSPTCTSRRVSAAVRSSSSRTTRPAGPRNDATSCSPNRIRPGPDGILRVPAAPGLGHRPRRGRRQALRRVTRRVRWRGRSAGERVHSRSEKRSHCRDGSRGWLHDRIEGRGVGGRRDG